MVRHLPSKQNRRVRSSLPSPDRESSNGRTLSFDPSNVGSIPTSRTNFSSQQSPRYSPESEPSANRIPHP